VEIGHKDLSIGPSFFHLPLFSFQRSKARFKQTGFRPEKSGQKILKEFFCYSFRLTVSTFFGRLVEDRRQVSPSDNLDL